MYIHYTHTHERIYTHSEYVYERFTHRRKRMIIFTMMMRQAEYEGLFQILLALVLKRKIFENSS